MDVGTRPDWGQFRPGTRSDWCPACGQNCLPGRTFCGVCSSHTDSTVLRVCRSLLLEAANPDGPAAEGDQQGSADHEVAVSYVADQFPLRFARLVGRNASSLKKAGAWFAHVVAFQHTTEEVFQYRAITPDRIFRNDTFKQVRDRIYETLHQIGTLPNQYFLCSERTDEDENRNSEDSANGEGQIPGLDVLDSYFNSGKETEGGARSLLFEMNTDLERRGKLRIHRGGGVCTKCGVSLIGGGSVCPSCRRAEQAMARLSIAWQKGTEQMKQPESSPTKVRGRMYHRSD